MMAVFFTGVVEDVNDPQELGRIRVRCIGYHSENRSEIPTTSLPWATVLMPVTSASSSGIGQSPTGILPGSWVMGIFRDGESAQDPLVLGSICSISGGADPRRGFSDPAGIHPRHPGSPDISPAATTRYGSHFSTIQKKNLEQKKIPQAVPPRVESVSIPESDQYYDRKTWDMPPVESYTAPRYPLNKAVETVNGHILELDDTPGKERISIHHASGSFDTIKNDGSRVCTIVGSDFEIVIGAQNIYVKGNRNITVDGDARTLVKGNYHLEVEGNYTEYVKGSRQIKVGLSNQEEIGQDLVQNIGGNRTVTVTGDQTTLVKSNDDQTVGGDKTFTVAGSYTDTVGENRSIVTGQNKSEIVNGTCNTAFTTSGYITVGDTKYTIDSTGFTIIGNSTVTGNSNITGDINLNGQLTVTDTVIMDGNVDIGGALTVGDTIEAGGEVTALDFNITSP